MIQTLRKNGRFIKLSEITQSDTYRPIRFLAWKFNVDIVEFIPLPEDTVEEAQYKLSQLFEIILKNKPAGNHQDFIATALVMIAGMPNANLMNKALYMLDALSYNEMRMIIESAKNPRQLYKLLMERYATNNSKGLNPFSRAVKEGKYDWEVLNNG